MGAAAGPRGLPPREKTLTEHHLEDMKGHTLAMQHFSKISNYLANERTFLAWTRTALSLLRTSFAFVSLKAVSESWLDALNGVTVIFAVLMFTFMLIGTIRYKDVRDALDKRNSPPTYMLRRMSSSHGLVLRGVLPIHILLLFTLLVVAFAA